ncbi:MAG: TIGR01212 family radical SAM protein [Bacteroidales bacterium]|jgi:radical SAM protein (TIGR01212 family)|nr:TIGR01212 family radical SAM protein [Bacteroidales bacterium]
MSYPWGFNRRFYAFANYSKQIFGERIQKLSINAGFTCPNRDGSIALGGCTYCDNNAFNPSYCDTSKSIAQQIEEGIDFHRNRYRRAKKYLAYFQAYSNTYASLDVLKEKYNQALKHPAIEGIIVGTRPDCIDEEKLTYFSEIAKRKYVVIEYGVESCNNTTLAAINRGHDFETSVRALELTHEKGIKSGVHIIFGLPNENKKEWMQWAAILSKLPIHSIKFHQLQILKNTPLASLYELQPELFYQFDFNEYVDFIIDFLEKLNPNFIVERFVGEVPPAYLLKKPWNNLRNDQVIQIIENKMEERNTWQGKYYKN